MIPLGNSTPRSKSRKFQSDAKTGFHIGVYGNLDLLTFYQDQNYNLVKALVNLMIIKPLRSTN